MLFGIDQKETAKKTFVQVGKMKIVVHSVEVVAIDTVSRLFNNSAKEVLLDRSKKNMRSGFLTYGLDFYTFFERNANMYEYLVIGGKSGSGKTYSLSELFLTKSENGFVRKTYEIDGVTTVGDIVYINVDNKMPTFPGSSFLYKEDKITPEINHHVGIDFNTINPAEYVSSILNRILPYNVPLDFSKPETMELIKSVAYIETLKSGQKIAHVNKWRNKPIIIPFFHLMEDKVFIDSNGLKEYSHSNWKLSYFGGMMEKFDTEGLFTICYYANVKTQKGKPYYYFDLIRSAHNTIRGRNGVFEGMTEIPNNINMIVDEILKPEAFNFCSLEDMF